MAEQPQEKPQQASQPIQTETKTVQAYAPQQPVVIKQGGGKALGIGALISWIPRSAIKLIRRKLVKSMRLPR